MPPWITPRTRQNRAKHQRWTARNPEAAKANSRRQNEYRKQWRRDNRDLVNAQERRSRAKNRESYNLRMQGWRYGLSRDDLKALIVKQGGRCAICGDAAPLHIDHDHQTKAVRALLCSRCNLGIGFFKDDPGRLSAARRYILKHRRTRHAV